MVTLIINAIFPSAIYTKNFPTCGSYHEPRGIELLFEIFLFQYASAVGVRVLIDAEQSYFQHAIEHVVLYYMMKKFNHTHPVIYNTVQAYLTVRVSLATIIIKFITHLSNLESTRNAFAAFDCNSTDGNTMWNKTGMK